MIALTGTLEKDTALQVGFVFFFLFNTKNRENLVASLRSSAVQGGGGGVRSSAVQGGGGGG